MSLWTPGGEHPVEREHSEQGDRDLEAPVDDPLDDPLADLTDDERTRIEAVAEEMAEVRRQVASVPASDVIANHVMGLFELGAIHLQQQPPNLDEARLAIDAMGQVVEGLAGRLGEHEDTMKDALGQIRLAFVQISGSAPQ
jgi:hypothetical protein